MTDLVEQAARVACPNGPDHDHQPNLDQGCNWALQLCQALADAGLLVDTNTHTSSPDIENPQQQAETIVARTVPSRRQIAKAVGDIDAESWPNPASTEEIADAIHALMDGQPTINEAKAQALEEFAAHIENTAQRDDVRLTEHAVNEAGGAYLAREQAHEIKDRK